MEKIKQEIKIIFISTFLVIIFFVIKNAQAATSTIRGAAWWGSQSSYLYFNCADDVVGDRLDVLNNLCGGSLYYFNNPYCGTGLYVFHFYSAPCSSSQHQVYINSNGNFSGSAWNYAKGIITFDGTTTPDNYDFNLPANGNCPACTASNNCLACYNENTQKVYGWAHAADNSWINLNPATTSPVQIKSWNVASSTSLGYINSDYLKPGDFIGYATTSSDIYDSLSFNCLSAGGGNGCTTYKIYISNLQIGHLSASNWNYSQACGGALLANLSWDLKSGGSAPNGSWPKIDYQTGFQVIVSTNNSTTTGFIYDSGLQSGSAQSFEINKTNFPAFTYDTNYYWWVRLRDQNNNWTEWYQFGATDGHNGPADTITDLGNTYSSPDAKTFKTYKHEFPSPYFTWSPYTVLVASSTEFTSIPDSRYYISGTPQACSGSNCLYLWTTNDTGALISNATSATTSITFFSVATTTVSLELRDTDNYFCSTSTALVINYDLPIWREVKAR